MRVDLTWQLQELLPRARAAFTLLKECQLAWPSEAALLLEPLSVMSAYPEPGGFLYLRLQDLLNCMTALQSTRGAASLWGQVPSPSAWERARQLPEFNGLSPFALVEWRRSWHFCELLLVICPNLLRPLAIYFAALLKRVNPATVGELQMLLLSERRIREHSQKDQPTPSEQSHQERADRDGEHGAAAAL